MMGHKICFYGEIWTIIPKLSLLLHIWSTDLCYSLKLESQGFLVELFLKDYEASVNMFLLRRKES